MSLIVSLYAAVLFFILTPSILLRIPKSGSKWVVAAVHALVFGVIFYFTNKLVWRLGARFEGFEPDSTDAGAPFVGAPAAASQSPTTPSLTGVPISTLSAAISTALPSSSPSPLPSVTPSISPSPSP
jgi:hypothetical protein